MSDSHKYTFKKEDNKQAHIFVFPIYLKFKNKLIYWLNI